MTCVSVDRYLLALAVMGVAVVVLVSGYEWLTGRLYRERDEWRSECNEWHALASELLDLYERIASAPNAQAVSDLLREHALGKTGDPS